MRFRNPRVTEDVVGEPVRIQGRILVPIARVTTRVRHQALIGTHREHATLQRSVRVRPVALVESTPNRVRRYAIRDRTQQWLGLMGWAAAVLFVAAGLVGRGHTTAERRSGDD